jgi:adenine phosphoribosyltransferase
VLLKVNYFVSGCKYISFYLYRQRTLAKNMIDIEQYIRNIPDFPKSGVVFKDITPLLEHPEALKTCAEALLSLTEMQPIDKVVGIESRGFFFATHLALALNAGFVPVRKPGKLPYATLKQPYTLEYGMDSLEIHEDAIQKGDKVLLHDDVLATGGTAQAACRLIEQLGGEIVQCNFLIELTFLKGASKLRNYEIRSLLTY